MPIPKSEIEDINSYWAWTDEDFVRIINLLNEKYKKAKKEKKNFLVIYEIRKEH